ncbi:CocE/NonD family hydrolase [Acrocarpospora macrocephala]|uniref:Peptidase S15 n=2 Tax=Acrocarpospora macrocephala TaxID=150177 RepID=A0A5M3WJE3_9ACTN|nr:peptidase S15 [Acrocarpospora macrocephala]
MRQYVGQNMTIDKDVPIPVRDGSFVMANVFRPLGDGPWPVIMNYGPYGKDVHFSEFMPAVWATLQDNHPEITSRSSLTHLTFETPDPEIWTTFGYALVRVDSRGAGKSPGLLHPNSPDEFQDAYEAVEWAAAAPWSNGKVGLLGISYYASGQWMIAQLRPPGLAALQPWQGTYDFYRDRTRQGGIFSSGFVDMWWNRCVVENQHGYASSRFTDYFTGERNTGPALAAEELAANRPDYIQDILDHPLEDDWYKARSADLEQIEVPALVVANWGGLQVHLRGTLLGFEGISSTEKWLRVQRGSYFMTFYHPDNVDIQRRFFDRYLKDQTEAWTGEPVVKVDVRSMDDGVARSLTATAWPLPDCVEQRFHLDAGAGTLSTEPPSTRRQVSFEARKGAAVFSTGPLQQDLTFAGPILLRLRLASTTSEADVFASLQAFNADGSEASFEDSTLAPSPVSQGWLRASHRSVDPSRSGFLRPFHDHHRHQPLVPGDAYDLEVELWPGSLSLPRGAELRLTISGLDFQSSGEGLANMGHDHPCDRPEPEFAGTHTISTGPDVPAYLALPSLEQQS